MGSSLAAKGFFREAQSGWSVRWDAEANKAIVYNKQNNYIYLQCITT